eukprot:1160098-Pelagomonas_calceolata.AAC.7
MKLFMLGHQRTHSFARFGVGLCTQHTSSISSQPGGGFLFFCRESRPGKFVSHNLAAPQMSLKQLAMSMHAPRVCLHAFPVKEGEKGSEGDSCSSHQLSPYR